ncbi:MAG: hypothetical protein QF362_00565 [Candidatus Woesearchaeota archaeon]|jgi:hypothetical protein|nr:hypothetical protein [Candidatus Woesearchaeota archaeon]MDP7505923.1 hypothetical protein [Candidatus Woesearchaeota archaeon]
MNQKIICRKGKCYEEDSMETKFDNMFDYTNIVDQIQHDLWKYTMG